MNDPEIHLKKKRRLINQINCPGNGPRCKLDESGDCIMVFEKPSGLTKHLSTELVECPECEKCFTQKGNMYTHMRKKHPEVELDVKPQAKHIKCPQELMKLVEQHEYGTLVTDVRNHIQGDIKKFPGHEFTKTINNNISIHEIAQALLRTWLTKNTDRRDMLGGNVSLEFVSHSSNKLTLDRKDDSLPHFLSYEDVFANLRTVPLKLNTQYSLIQLFGDDTRAKVKSMVLEHRSIDVDVEAQITAYKQLSKNKYKNLIYCHYNNCKKRNKTRHQKIHAPLPKVKSFEQFQEQFFKSLCKQKGKCVISGLVLNYNFTGYTQFQISVDRIDVHDINYWNWDNLQLVCVALNVIDHSRRKKYKSDEDDEGAGITPEWFYNYFMT